MHRKTLLFFYFKVNRVLRTLGPKAKTRSFLLTFLKVLSHQSSKELHTSCLRPYLVKSNNFKSLSTVKEGGEREKMCDNGLRSAVADMSAAG